jgi:hypothetical protein
VFALKFTSLRYRIQRHWHRKVIALFYRISTLLTYPCRHITTIMYCRPKHPMMYARFRGSYHLLSPSITNSSPPYSDDALPLPMQYVASVSPSVCVMYRPFTITTTSFPHTGHPPQDPISSLPTAEVSIFGEAHTRLNSGSGDSLHLPSPRRGLNVFITLSSTLSRVYRFLTKI